MFKIQTLDTDGSWFTLSTAHTRVFANEIAEAISKQWKNTTAVRVVATNNAELTDIVAMLNRLGFNACVTDLGRFEGQPLLIDIESPSGKQYTLYQNLTDEETVAGTGYYLMTDEMESVAENIPNANAEKVAGIVAYNLGRADFDQEANR
jgi:hypothetical protein